MALTLDKYVVGFLSGCDGPSVSITRENLKGTGIQRYLYIGEKPYYCWKYKPDNTKYYYEQDIPISAFPSLAKLKYFDDDKTYVEDLSTTVTSFNRDQFERDENNDFCLCNDIKKDIFFKVEAAPSSSRPAADIAKLVFAGRFSGLYETYSSSSCIDRDIKVVNKPMWWPNGNYLNISCNVLHNQKAITIHLQHIFSEEFDVTITVYGNGKLRYHDSGHYDDDYGYSAATTMNVSKLTAGRVNIEGGN